MHDPLFRGGALQRELDRCRLKPADLVFEISERESIGNFSLFRQARDYYKGLGFRMALDDTGAGYASLEAVMELAPKFIKVDMSLVRSIDTDPTRQAMLKALHSVADHLGASVIGEGVETESELLTIQQLGIPYGQGYLFGRPGPLESGFEQDTSPLPPPS
ncbi:MAG: EAL domain-containing protein [Acidobacteriota bacterium]|nr:MAG: EAL domain-containing protein [Acidobacteriota bacterium]